MAPNDKASAKPEAPKGQTEAAAHEAHDLAKEAKVEQGGESPDVALASAGRVASMDRVDEMAEDARAVLGSKDSEGHERGSRRAQHRELAGKPYVALQPILRNGKPVYPGEAIKFDEDEGEHVLDLLAAKSIAGGSAGDEEVKDALGRADLARGKALAS